MGSGFDGRVLIVDPIIDEDGFLRLELIFLVAVSQPIDLGGVVHELAMLYTFDRQKVGHGCENVTEVGHLRFDIKGR